MRDTRGVAADTSSLEALLALLPEGDWVEAVADREGYEERLERLREVAAPDLEVAMVGPGGFTGTFRGVEGFREGWEDWLRPFERYTVDPGEFEQVGDNYLFTGRQTAVPKGTDAAMEGTASAVFFFRGNRLARVEFHLDPDAARRAAGLADG